MSRRLRFCWIFAKTSPGDPGDPGELFARYLECIRRLVEFVDRLEAKQYEGCALIVVGVVVLIVLILGGTLMGDRNDLVTEREAINGAYVAGGRRAAAPRRPDSEPG